MESSRPRHWRALGLLLPLLLLLLLLGVPREIVAAAEDSPQSHVAVSPYEQAAAELQLQDVASRAANDGHILNTEERRITSRGGRMIDFGSGLWNLMGQISMSDFEAENNGLSSGFYKYYRETRRRLDGKQQPYNEFSREKATHIPQTQILTSEKTPINEEIQHNVGNENIEINMMSPQTYDELKRLGYDVDSLTKQDVSNDKIFSNEFKKKGAYINNYHSSSRETPSMYSTKTTPGESIIGGESNPISAIKNLYEMYISDGNSAPLPSIHSGRISNSQSSPLGATWERSPYTKADKENDAGESVTAVKYMNTFPSQNSNPLSSTKYFLSSSYVDPTSSKMSEHPVEMKNLFDPSLFSVENMGPNALRNGAEESMSQLLSVQNFNIFNSNPSMQMIRHKPETSFSYPNGISRSPELLDSEQSQTYYVNENVPHKTVYPRPMKVVMSNENFMKPTNVGRQPERVTAVEDVAPQALQRKNHNENSAFSSILNGGQNSFKIHIENELDVGTKTQRPSIPYTIRQRNPYNKPSVVNHSVNKNVPLTPLALSDLKTQLPDHVVAMVNNISDALGENPTHEAWTTLFQRFEHFFKHAERVLSGENQSGIDNPVLNSENGLPNSLPQQIVSPVEIRIPVSILSDSVSTQHLDPTWNEASQIIDDVSEVVDAQLPLRPQHPGNNRDEILNPFDSVTNELINSLIEAHSSKPLINYQVDNVDVTELKTKLSEMLSDAEVSILRDPPSPTDNPAALGQRLKTQITVRPGNNESLQSWESHYFQPVESDIVQSSKMPYNFQTDKTQIHQSVKSQDYFSPEQSESLISVSPQNNFSLEQSESLLTVKSQNFLLPQENDIFGTHLPDENLSDDLTTDDDQNYDKFPDSKEHLLSQNSVPPQVSGIQNRDENSSVVFMTNLNYNQPQDFHQPEIVDNVSDVPSRLVIVYKPVLFVSHENGSHWSRVLGKGFRPTVLTESGETSAALTKEVLDALDPDLLENIRDHFVRDELNENPKVSEITVETGDSLSKTNQLPDKFIILDDLEDIRVNETEQQNASSDSIKMEENISTTTPRSSQPTKPSSFIDMRNMNINTLPEVVDIKMESVKSIRDLIKNSLMTQPDSEEKVDGAALTLSGDSNKFNFVNNTDFNTVNDTRIDVEESGSKLRPLKYVHNIILSRNSDISLEEPKGSQVHALSELEDVNPGMWWITNPSKEKDTKKQYVIKRIVKRRMRKPSRLRSRIFAQRVNSGNSPRILARAHPTERLALPGQMPLLQKEQARSLHQRPKVIVIARPMKRGPLSSEARRLGHLKPVPKHDAGSVTTVENPIENISQLVRRLYNSVR